MENIISKTFLNYLLNIGIIDFTSAKNILSTFNNITNSNGNIDFQNAMCASLIFYFSNLDDNQKRNISFNLILKFFENTINRKLISLLCIFNLKVSKNKYKLLKYFYKWKKNSKKLLLNLSNDYIPSKRKNLKNYRSKSINLSKNSNSKSNITNYNKNIINNNNNNNNNNKNIINNKSNSNSNSNYNISTSKKNNSVSNKNLMLESSLDKKTREDLEHCTFTPSINHSNLYTNTNESVYLRLYKDGEKYKSKRQMRIQEFEHIKSNENSFTPKKYSTPRKFKSKDKFIDRQKVYFEKKFLNQMKLITKINEDFSKNCSFSPQIYSKNSNNTNNIETSVFQRLYDDDIKRRNKLQEYITNSNNNNNTYKKNTTQSNGQVDLNKIEELYNQYKYKNLNLLNLQRKYDDEEGITFQPTINKNPIYENKLYGSNFYERNLKTLDTKNKFIENYETLEKERFRQNQIDNKKYTKLEKEQITKKIIDRLYNNSSSSNSKNNIKNNNVNNDVQNLKINNINNYNNKNLNLNNNNFNNNIDYNNNNINSENLKEIENEEDNKYNDRIINIDELTFGKNKGNKLINLNEYN